MGLKKELLEHKAFWGVLAVIVVLPIISMIDNGNNLNGNATQNIAYMKTGDKLYLEVDDYGVKSITFTILEDVKNSKVVNRELEELSWDFNGKLYSMFEVSSEDADKLGNLEFNLKIKEDDLYKISLNRNEVKLYLDGDELDTTLTDIKDDYVYYQATADKMGQFAIGRAEAVEEVVEEPEVIEDEQVEPEVQEPAPLPVIKEVEEEKGFFAWLKGLFS
jgi:PGF-pre-PGF domain-containing protein